MSDPITKEDIIAAIKEHIKSASFIHAASELLGLEISLEIIRQHMALHNLAVVMPFCSYREDEILCDPIIFTDHEIEGRCTMQQWKDIDRSGETLSERLSEEATEYIGIILSEFHNGSTNQTA